MSVEIFTPTPDINKSLCNNSSDNKSYWIHRVDVKVSAQVTTVTYMHQSEPSLHSLLINFTVHLQLWPGNHFIWCNATLRAYDAILTDIYDFCRFNLTIIPRFIFELLSVCNNTRYASWTRKLMICLTTSCVLFVYCIWVCYSGILYQNCVLQWCWQFVRIFLQIVRIFCHDLTDISCPRLTGFLWLFITISRSSQWSTNGVKKSPWYVLSCLWDGACLKEPRLLFGKSSLCGGSGCFL